MSETGEAPDTPIGHGHAHGLGHEWMKVFFEKVEKNLKEL